MDDFLCATSFHFTPADFIFSLEKKNIATETTFQKILSTISYHDKLPNSNSIIETRSVKWFRPHACETHST
jgi:hypothetical protein